MKYVKVLALVLGTLVMTACSDKEDYNTAAGVSVEMAQSELTLKEGAGIVKVPIKVTGESNGPVKVEVKVEATGDSPALPYEDRNGTYSGDYVVTSETVIIGAGETSGGVELNVFDDLIENGDRTFKVTITSVEGATLGGVTSTVVTIKDNDSIPYEKVQGAWKWHCIDFDGNELIENVTIEGNEEGQPGYGEELYLCGLLNNPTELTLAWYEDETTGKKYVELNLPEAMIWYDSAAGQLIWAVEAIDGNPLHVNLAPVSAIGELSDDMQTITFDPDFMISYAIANTNLSQLYTLWDSATKIVMTRN